MPSPTPLLGLHGAGMISAAHAASARHLGWSVGPVASRSPERAQEEAARWGGRAVGYGDLPDGADIVVVCTPPGDHASATTALLGRGTAVVLEKPLCRTLQEADELVAAAGAHGQRVLYPENLGYAPAVLEVLRLLPRLGPLDHLEVRAINPGPGWGGFLTDEWGGGALFDLGVHPLAVALLAARPARLLEVHAHLEGGADHRTDEHARVELRYDTGLRATVVSSWRGGHTPQWDVQAASGIGVVRAELLPTPLVELDGDEVPLPAVSAPVPALEQYGYVGQLAAFGADLRAGKRPFMDVEFGRHVLDVVCAAYAAARTGVAEPVPFHGPRDRTPLQLWRGG